MGGLCGVLTTGLRSHVDFSGMGRAGALVRPLVLVVAGAEVLLRGRVFEVGGCGAEDVRAVSGCRQEPPVAHAAQQPPHESCRVAVVDGQALSPGSAADGAAAFLELEELGVLAGQEPVGCLYAGFVTGFAPALLPACRADASTRRREESFRPPALAPGARPRGRPAGRHPVAAIVRSRRSMRPVSAASAARRRRVSVPRVWTCRPVRPCRATTAVVWR